MHVRFVRRGTWETRLIVCTADGQGCPVCSMAAAAALLTIRSSAWGCGVNSSVLGVPIIEAVDSVRFDQQGLHRDCTWKQV